jgi:hypothetical protein
LSTYLTVGYTLQGLAVVSLGGGHGHLLEVTVILLSRINNLDAGRSSIQEPGEAGYRLTTLSGTTNLK